MRTGLERLIEDVKKDCQEGCFNMNGCDHEFSKIIPETDPKMKNLGLTKKCVKVSKCTHRYCDKLKWILDRAYQYADAIGVSRDEVIDKWEAGRNYWYMNYYQECNQPALDGKTKVVKIKDWHKELIARFGKNHKDWKFICPACGHIQSISDFMEIDIDPNYAYSNCIGRHTGRNDKTGKEGCNYTINGLISLNKTTVINENYIPVKVFEMAREK